MLTAQIDSNGQLQVVDAAHPSLPEGGARLQVLGCGLCGSDLDKLLNHKASSGTVLGHEVVGIIEELSAGHPSGFQVGDRVVAAHHVPCLHCHYCLNQSQSMCRHFKATNFIPGGFAQFLTLTREHLQHTTFPIPVTISDAEASCVEPLACVVQAVERGGNFINGSVAVIGLGFIGLMASQLYKQQGYQVYGLDLSQERLDLAVSQGWIEPNFTQSTDLNVDLVFLTVVTPKTLSQALKLVRDGGTIVLFTSAAAGTMLDPSQLYFREINIVSSYSPSLSALQRSAHLIFNRQIDLSPLLTHERSLFQIQEAVALYRSGQALKVFIQMTTPESDAPCRN